MARHSARWLITCNTGVISSRPNKYIELTLSIVPSASIKYYGVLWSCMRTVLDLLQTQTHLLLFNADTHGRGRDLRNASLLSVPLSDGCMRHEQRIFVANHNKDSFRIACEPTVCVPVRDVASGCHVTVHAIPILRARARTETEP